MSHSRSKAPRLAGVLLLSVLASGCGTAMTKAINKDDAAAVDALIARGADPNRYFAGLECEFGIGRCITEWTPLMWATLGGNVHVAEVLIKRGAKVDLPCKSEQWLGWTALCMAANASRAKHVPAARLLLQHGANPRVSCGGGKTPLDFAREKGNQEMIRLLQDPGANAAPAASLDEHLPAIKAHEDSADAAREAGKSPEALAAYVLALKAVPSGGGANPRIQKLREKVIRYAASLSPRPEVPEEARGHAVKGQAFIKLGTGPDDLRAAQREFYEAIQSAPWWGGAYYNLALVSEKLGQFDTAKRCLGWYLLLEPDSPDAQAVKDKLYELEVAKERAGRQP